MIEWVKEDAVWKRHGRLNPYGWSEEKLPEGTTREGLERELTNGVLRRVFRKESDGVESPYIEPVRVFAGTLNRSRLEELGRDFAGVRAGHLFFGDTSADVVVLMSTFPNSPPVGYDTISKWATKLLYDVFRTVCARVALVPYWRVGADDEVTAYLGDGEASAHVVPVLDVVQPRVVFVEGDALWDLAIPSAKKQPRYAYGNVLFMRTWARGDMPHMDDVRRHRQWAFENTQQVLAREVSPNNARTQWRFPL